VNLNKDIKDLFERQWHIIFGDLKLFPHGFEDFFCLLDGICFPFVIGFSTLLGLLLRLLDRLPNLLVLGELISNKLAQDVNVHILAQIKQNLKLKEHRTI